MITVAAIMPTIKSHARFRATAEACFAAQVVPADWFVNLMIDENETESLGKKLNRMLAGCVTLGIDYAVLWDDDDYHSKDRIRRQIEPLLVPGGIAQVSGSSKVYYHVDGTENAWLYTGDPAIWLYGLAFPVSTWQKFPFEDISRGVDTVWLKKNIPPGHRFDVNDPAMSIATAHPANTCRKHFTGPNWSSVDMEKIKCR